MAPEYVRLTFTPAGATRRRTVWAERGSERKGLVTFWRVDRHGERSDPAELIMARTTECTIRAARMNLKYAELEIAPMPQTYTVQTHNADGTVTVETLTMSPEMERINDEIKSFNGANPDFWCKCGKPETGRIEPRGHSVDVFCKNCGGCLQVG